MKTIFIARHSKSSWRNADLQDLDRPLKSSGIKACQRVAQSLMNADEYIDALFSSPAIRALHTAIIHARAFEFPESRIEIKKSIYYNNKEGVYELIKSLNNSYNSIMVVGHDPTLSNFVNDYLIDPLDRIQTSGVIKISLDTNNWTQIRNAEVFNLVYYKREEVKEIKYVETKGRAI